MVHGGDIYRNQVKWDFSVNINPLGIPENVKRELIGAAALCDRYPDIETKRLTQAMGKKLSIPEKNLLFGNGASELLLAVIHALMPQKTVIPTPSFYGYEHAARAGNGEIFYYPMKADFVLDEGILAFLKEDVDLLILANPNNPTGKLIPPDLLKEILELCRKKKIYVLVDECFMEFCKEDSLLLPVIEKEKQLILLRAFTKIFAIPGVRLGYLISGSQKLLEQVKRHLPEWNISIFAQQAGIACTKEEGFLQETKTCVQKEREYLREGLKAMGLRVFQSSTDFILLYTEIPLYEKLLERGILIRDCSNFRGLSKGYYRIAVKGREENEELLNVMGEIL